VNDAQLIRKVIDDNGMLLADMARFFGKCPSAISKMLMTRGCSLAAVNRGRPRAIVLVQCEEDGVNDEEEDVEVEFKADADAVMTLDEVREELQRTRAALESAESEREQLQKFVAAAREELEQARISASICRGETMRADCAERERDSVLGKLNKTRLESALRRDQMQTMSAELGPLRVGYSALKQTLAAKEYQIVVISERLIDLEDLEVDVLNRQLLVEQLHPFLAPHYQVVGPNSGGLAEETLDLVLVHR
jgi:hypothetical protein